MVRNKIKHFGLLCYRAGDNLVHNYGLEVAGYLTFLELLALFPYLLLMVSTLGIFGQGETGRQVIGWLIAHVPSDAVATLRPRIEEIVSGPPQGLLTFAILGAIWTSSSAVEAVRGVLNRAYHVHKPPAYLARRLTSMAQVLMLTLLLLVVTLLVVLLPAVWAAITHFTGLALPTAVSHGLAVFYKPLAALGLFTVVAAFYYVLPNIRQEFMAVAPGALLVVVLWVGGASLVGVYLHHVSNVTLIYGSLSGFIATLVSFYVLNLIFIYGAEFNHERLVMLGKRIVERVR